jgi:hypothetical protein
MYDLDYTYHIPATNLTYFYDKENKVLGAKNSLTNEVLAYYKTNLYVGKDNFKDICRNFFIEVVNTYRAN